MRPLLSKFLIIAIIVFYSITATSQQRSLCSERFISSFNVDKGKGGNLDCTANENSEIQRKVEKLMRSLNLPMNFVICKRKGSGNASARIDENGIRWIIYDDQFLKKFNTDSSEFESMAILAHEIGHHLSNHLITSIHQDYASVYSKFCLPGSTFDSSKCKQEKEAFMRNYRQHELEADRYAGYLMFKLGANLEQVKRLYINIDQQKQRIEDSTHPELSKRIDALQDGYNLSKSSSLQNKLLTSQEIKGGSTIYFGSAERLTRRKIFHELIIRQALSTVAQNLNNDSQFSFGSSIHEITDTTSKECFLVRNFFNQNISSLKVDTDEELLEVRRVFVELSLDREISVSQSFLLHIKGGVLKIVFLDTDRMQTEVIYTCPFLENQISVAELNNTVTEILRQRLQPIIEKRYGK